MTVEATPDGRSARPSIGSRLWDAPGAFYLLVFPFTVLSFATPDFLTSANLINIILQASVILILALGVTLVIITEGIDLSLRPVLGFAGVVLALMLVGGFGFPLAMLAALLAAMAVGAPQRIPRRVPEPATNKEEIVRLIMTGGLDPAELAAEGHLTPPGAMASA